ncbi:Uncharacterized protein Rs2_02649 [Raphanus sativus]|nr:Uncharacterized protein Rs2_02649 [Raphanus sativus]
MAERVETSVPEGENTIEEREVGAMWELEQKLDQPMDEEATKINSMAELNRETDYFSLPKLFYARFLATTAIENKENTIFNNETKPKRRRNMVRLWWVPTEVT